MSRPGNFGTGQKTSSLRKQPPRVSIEKLTTAHLSPLLEIVQDPDVMQWIAKGGIWTKSELGNKLEMSERDWASVEKGQVARYYCWAILAQNQVCGIYQFGKSRRSLVLDYRYRSRCFLGQEFQGRGIGTKAREMALAKLALYDASVQSVVSEVRPENHGALKSLRKTGYQYVGPVSIGLVNLLQFEIDPNPITRPYTLRSNRKTVDADWLLAEMQRGLPFPYHRFFLPPPSEMFSKLCHVMDTLKVVESNDNPEYGHYIVPFQGKFTTVVRQFHFDFWTTDALSNYYTEDARIWCSRGKQHETLAGAWSGNGYYKSIVSYFTDIFNELLDVEPIPCKPGGEIARALREAVLAIPETKECTIFNPALGVYLIRRLAGKNARVLDPSAGWGDRLLAALASGAECYHGYDPNPRLQHGYSLLLAAHAVTLQEDMPKGQPGVTGVLGRNLPRPRLPQGEHSAGFRPMWTTPPGNRFQALSSKGQVEKCDAGSSSANCMKNGKGNATFTSKPTNQGVSNYQALPSECQDTPKGFWVGEAPFERPWVIVREEYYDIVITSPPFYDLEIYDDGPGQALIAYPTKQCWVEDFLTKYLEKAWASLKTGGHMALYMQTLPAFDFVSEARHIIENFPNSEFLGVIGFRQECPTSSSVARPTWIWRKGIRRFSS